MQNITSAGKKTPEQIVQAIFALDLESVKQQLRDHEDGKGWTASEANYYEMEYKQFLALSAKYPDADISPSKNVDAFWHTHILDTRKYARDCEATFGYFIHHVPGARDGSVEEKARYEKSFNLFAQLQQQEFAVTETTQAAYCGRSGQKDEAGYCGLASHTETNTAAYCGRSPAESVSSAAYCGLSKKASAAYCGLNISAGKEELAYCGLSKPGQGEVAAYCGRSAGVKVETPAYCGLQSASDKSGAAYCGLSAPDTRIAAYCGLSHSRENEQPAYCGLQAPRRSEQAAYCGRSAASVKEQAAYCGRSVSPVTEEPAYCGRAPSEAAVAQAAP